MPLRDHDPIVIEEFYGLWARGGADSCPIDHFTDCNNVVFIESGFETRPGLDILLAKGNVLRIYNYKTQTQETLLILDTSGDIYHALLNEAGTVYGPILSIPEMTDFGFISYNGRAYISPFTTYTDDVGIKYQAGLEDEFVYVYKGDGTAARKAAGSPPTNGGGTTFKAFNSRYDGVITKGVHLVTVLYNGTTLALEVFPVVYAPGNKEIQLTDIPIGPGGTTSRVIAMTHAIDPKDYIADQSTYTYYEALTISDNETTSAKLSIPDANLTTPVSLGAIPTSSQLLAENTDEDGFADLGLHLIAVVYETDTGYLSAPGPENFAVVTVVDVTKAIKVSNIPVSPDSFVTKRHLVATRAIPNYNGDQTGYELYFIPEGTLDNNTDTELTVSFYDFDLLEDASYLIDNFSEIPAGVCLTTYHGRMVLTTTYTDISLAYLSAPGEPEAIDQVDGIVIVPLDGNPITAAQEFRDVLYLFKKTRTYPTVDNSDEPSTWSIYPLDQGIGASIHGVAAVLDSGGVNIDFLIVIDYSGVMLFNGTYSRPELSWKIQDFWLSIDRNNFANIQIMNDSLNQLFYITMPDKQMIIGDYRWGMNARDMRWAKWSFDIETTSIALIRTDVLIIGSDALAIIGD